MISKTIKMIEAPKHIDNGINSIFEAQFGCSTITSKGGKNEETHP